MLLQGIEHLVFSIDKLAESVERIANYVETMVKTKNKDELLGLFIVLVAIAIVGIIAALLLSQKK